MSQMKSCEPVYEFTTGDGINVDVTGSGTPSDPYLVDHEINVNPAPNNELKILPDGSLFVSPAAVGNALEGGVAAPYNFNYPVDGLNQIQIGLQFDDGGFVPYDANTGIWQIPRVSFPDNETWPLGCPINQGEPVYRDPNNASRLFTTPHDEIDYASLQSPVSNVFYTTGAVYNEIFGQYQNLDTCQRDVLLTTHYDWAGFEVSLGDDDGIAMEHQYITGVNNINWSNFTISRARLQNTNLGAGRLLMTVGDVSRTIQRVVPFGDIAFFGARYRIPSTGLVGNPSGATTQQVNSCRVTIEVHTL